MKKKKQPSKANKTTIRTSERARELSTLRHRESNRSHGMSEVQRTGQRKCLPGSCARRNDCPFAAMSEKERPSICQPLEAHITAWTGAMLTQDRMDSAKRGLILNAARLEKMIIVGKWFADAAPLFFVKHNRLCPQPALTFIQGLIASQSRILKAIGPTEVVRLDPARSFAASVVAA